MLFRREIYVRRALTASILVAGGLLFAGIAAPFAADVVREIGPDQFSFRDSVEYLRGVHQRSDKTSPEIPVRAFLDSSLASDSHISLDSLRISAEEFSRPSSTAMAVSVVYASLRYVSSGVKGPEQANALLIEPMRYNEAVRFELDQDETLLDHVRSADEIRDSGVAFQTKSNIPDAASLGQAPPPAGGGTGSVGSLRMVARRHHTYAHRGSRIAGAEFSWRSRFVSHVAREYYSIRNGYEGDGPFRSSSAACSPSHPYSSPFRIKFFFFSSSIYPVSRTSTQKDGFPSSFIAFTVSRFVSSPASDGPFAPDSRSHSERSNSPLQVQV